MNRGWFFLFFFVSGFCSLVYEVVWLRLTMAAFGVNAPIVATFLSVFMAGIGIGSMIAGPIARRLSARSPGTLLRGYALVELMIGASALLVPALISYGRNLLDGPLGGVSWGSTEYYVMTAAWIVVILLPWSMCMGATFPLAMGALRQSREETSSGAFGYLYLANVIGATYGTLLSAVVLIEWLGFGGSLYLVAGLNGLLFCAAFALSVALGPAETRSPAPVVVHTASAPATPIRRHASLWMLFTTGLMSMAMEVIWVRQFTPYLGNVVYAIAAILVIYLSATAAGAFLWVRFGRPLQGPRVWLLIGALGLLPLLGADPRTHLPDILRVIVFITPFCIALGMLMPSLVDQWSSGDPSKTGLAYATNVLGSTTGPLIAGFILLPLLGDRWSLIVCAVPALVIAASEALRVLSRGDRPAFGSIRPVSAAALVALTVLLATQTVAFEDSFPNKLLLRDQEASVVATGVGMNKNLFVNGISMTVLTPTTKMMTMLTAAHLSRPPERVLIVAIGMGTSLRSAHTWGTDVTAVDLIPSVPLLLDYFHSDIQAVIGSERTHIVVDDGRRLLRRIQQRYDIIVIDPPPPFSATGSSLLYSEEFYAIARARMNDDGILQQWVPIEEGINEVEPSIVKALVRSFRYVRMFDSPTSRGHHFLASDSPIPFDSAQRLAGRLPPLAAADLVEWGPASTPVEQFQAVLDGEIDVGAFLATMPNAPSLTDDRPVNEYFLLRVLFGS